MTIEEALSAIKNAVYGKDVRQAMHDGILQAEGGAGTVAKEAAKSAQKAAESSKKSEIASKAIEGKADQAVTIAKSAKNKSDSTQLQLDEIVINGDSSVEAAQARVDIKNITHATLKDRLDKEQQEVATQLQQTNLDTIATGEAIENPGVMPVNRPTKIKVLSPLDGNILNYAGDSGYFSGHNGISNPIKVLSKLDGNTDNLTGGNGTIQGTLTYAPSTFHNGAKFDGGQMVTYPYVNSNPIPSGTLFARFKPVKNIEPGGDLFYPIAKLINAAGIPAVTIELDYRTATAYNGIHVTLRNGGDIRTLSAKDLNFSQGTVYTIAVTWDYDEATSLGRVRIYLDGYVVLNATFEQKHIPIGSTAIRVGNEPALNRPAQSVIDSVVFSEAAMGSLDISKLHAQPIDETASYDLNAYNLAPKKVKFYKGLTANGGKIISLPTKSSSGEVRGGALSFKFRPSKSYTNALNGEFVVASLLSVSGIALEFKLSYQNGLNYNGIAITMRNATGQSRLLVASHFSFTKGKTYTLGVEWVNGIGSGTGYLSIYIDGVNIKTGTLENNINPIDVYQLDLGAGVEGEFEGVYYAEEPLGVAGHLELHRKPMILDSIETATTYNPEYKAVGYSRETSDYTILNYFDGITWGIKTNKLSELCVSHDDGVTWESYQDFTISGVDVRVSLVEKHGDYLFVFVREGAKGYLRRANYGTKNFTDSLQTADGMFAVNGWNWSTFNEHAVISEYGGMPAGSPSRLWVSSDYGQNWTLRRTLGGNTRHIHATLFDPHTGYLWLTYGDATAGVEYSKDLGVTWTVVDKTLDGKGTSMIFTKEAVVIANDHYPANAQLKLFNKYTNTYSNLSPQQGKYMTHVYAIHLDTRGYVWWYGNREQIAGKVNSINISSDLGVTPIMLEDLGEYAVSHPTRFVEAGKYFYLGNQRLSKVLVKRVS